MANEPALQLVKTDEPETPHNLAAEMAVLGAILYNNNAYERVSDVLRPTDFYAPANGAIYEVAQQLIVGGRVADGVTLREHFERDGELAEIGGAQYLEDLLDSAAFGPEIIDYGFLIRDLAVRRELIDIGSEVVQHARRGDHKADGAAQIESAERRLFDLAERGTSSGGFENFGSALAVSIEMATAAYKRDGKIAGISTGLEELDERLGGLHPSDLIILAGRPSMGKSGLATNIAVNIASKCKREVQADGSKKSVDGGVVGFFSLEMSSEQLATRIVSDVASISSHKIRQGDLEPRDYEKLRDAAARIETLPLHIDDTGGISISQLAARARRLQRSHGLDVLIVDYLQLVTATTGSRSDGRVQEVSLITQNLKALAKELNIPIIALAQLSRQVEMRDDKRPQLADLRESGSIEQDADAVLFVYRESYYLERQEPDQADEAFAEWQEKMAAKRNVAEVIIGKQRHGPIGKVELSYEPNYVRFGNLERRYGSGE